MTIAMPDSITPGNIPMGYAAYLGYADGKWPTAARLPALFPGARIVSLTVTGATLDADGIDVEPGNPNAASGADWVRRKLAADPASRPVAYASRDGQPGYGMSDVIAELLALGINRTQWRMLTAHYTGHAHVCSPAACGAKFTADGTQWTSMYPGLSGSRIDMSVLAGDFFGAPAPAPQTAPGWTETIVQQLPVLSLGATGTHVRTVQFQLREKGRTEVVVDGNFGPVTAAAVEAVQADRHLTQDGTVGPETWPVLLGVS
jgi:hypothetical protein